MAERRGPKVIVGIQSEVTGQVTWIHGATRFYAMGHDHRPDALTIHLRWAGGDYRVEADRAPQDGPPGGWRDPGPYERIEMRPITDG